MIQLRSPLEQSNGNSTKNKNIVWKVNLALSNFCFLLYVFDDGIVYKDKKVIYILMGDENSLNGLVDRVADAFLDQLRVYQADRLPGLIVFREHEHLPDLLTSLHWSLIRRRLDDPVFENYSPEMEIGGSGRGYNVDVGALLEGYRKKQ